MKTNETIFAEIKAAGFMTEKQMQLLKNRSNKEQRDLFPYDEFNDYIPISEEWASRGLKWLRSLLNKNGEPKLSTELGFREAEIIKTANASEFSFVCFYNSGSEAARFYIPVYKLAGMKYRVEGGEIIIVG